MRTHPKWLRSNDNLPIAARLLIGDVLLTTVIQQGPAASSPPCSGEGCSGLPAPPRSAASAFRPVEQPPHPIAPPARTGRRPVQFPHAVFFRLPAPASPVRSHPALGRKSSRRHRIGMKETGQGGSPIQHSASRGARRLRGPASSKGSYSLTAPKARPLPFTRPPPGTSESHPGTPGRTASSGHGCPAPRRSRCPSSFGSTAPHPAGISAPPREVRTR